jgi:glucokinase
MEQTSTSDDLIEQASKLPHNEDRAVAFPLGGSTFRALIIDRHDNILDQLEVQHPADHHETIEHAIAGALVQFGCLPAAGAAFIAGSVPQRGPLKFTNLEWPEFDRNGTKKLFGFKTEWMQDGTAGYYGVKRLETKDFVPLRRGGYKKGDHHIYAIFGTGLNTGSEITREDGHLLFVPRGAEDTELQSWYHEAFGHWPEWEDVTSGGTGFRKVAQFYMQKRNLPKSDEFFQEFVATVPLRQAEVVTRYALTGHKVARESAAKVFEYLGSWLGAMAVSHQAVRIDLSPGILSLPELRKFCLEETRFLEAFEEQGRPMFSERLKQCTIRVCRRNPEPEGAVERAAELLRASS